MAYIQNPALTTTACCPLLRLYFLEKCLLVYGNTFFIQKKRLNDRNWEKMALSTIGLFLAIFIIEVILAYTWSLFDKKIVAAEYFRFWKLNALFFVCYYGVSTAYSLSKNWWENEKKRQQAEKEKLNAELNYLKSQINPHFFFNTLNNLYALSERQQNTDLSAGIAGLSDLMRYMLYDAKADYVPLEKEIAHIKSTIEVHQLRYDENDDYTISFNVDRKLKNKKVAPLIFAPFVENAFKHGIEIGKPSFIKINLSATENGVDFEVVNSNFNKAKNEHQHVGIGLKNVKRRLQLIYPKRHLLTIENNSKLFKINLKLTDLDNGHSHR